jgi:hypothetical protein
LRSGKSNIRLVFGDFVSDGRPIFLDPSIMTFNSEAGLDGYIEHVQPVVNTESSELIVGQEMPVYREYRSYLSFDTSAIPSLAYGLDTDLLLKTSRDASSIDFDVEVLSDVIDEQPMYGNSLEPSDWGSGTAIIGYWNTANYPGDQTYIDVHLAAWDQINRTGRTQFEFVSSHEGTPPQQDDYVCFCSANALGGEPKLQITYSLDTTTIDGVTFFYRNAGGNKAAVVIFGAEAGYDFLLVRSIEYPDEKSSEKLKFLSALIDAGISVLVARNDSTHVYHAYYDKSSIWVQGAAIWLLENQLHEQVFLFGFSGGGIVVAYEIQKDYSTRFSAAITTCAPVDWDGVSGDPIFQSAHTASLAKMPTCIPEPIDDAYYGQMESYYNNLLIHREWHNWIGAHSFFPYTCLDHGEENASDVVINWFSAAHPPSNPFLPSGTHNGYVYAAYSYSSGAFDANGNNIRYEFDWGDGTTNTTSFHVSGENVSSAHFWERPDAYYVKVRAQDSTQNWSNWSPECIVTITQNDVGSGADAGNTFSTATSIGYGSYGGCSLYQSNPQDMIDYYKFYETGPGQSTYISMTPPSGQDFNLYLYNSSGILKASSTRGPGLMEEISYTIDSGGYWRILVYAPSGGGQQGGEGQYSLFFGTAPPGGDGCPTLFVWNGTEYADHGVIPIHDPSGQDIIRQIPLAGREVAVDNYVAKFKLREGWPELNFSESVIDQVRLYAVDEEGNCHLCPLINATHSRLGNVILKLLFSDDWRAQTLFLETIDLQFLMPYPEVENYVFHIEGCNQLKQ